jgi:capsid protein
MTDGVMFNKFGAVVGYNVIRSDGTTRLIPASAMLHVHIPEQVSGARAYSPIQHSINNLIDVLEILSLEKVAMKVQGDIVRTVTRENPQFDGTDADFQAFGMRPQDYPQGVYDNPEQVGAFIGGKTLSLAPGEELKMVESGRPSPNVTNFIEHNNRDSTQGFMPYEFVDLTKATGAGMRVTLGKVDRTASARQDVLIQRCIKQIRAFVLGVKITRGELAPNDNFTRAAYVTPRRITADAGREAAANQKDIEMGLKTLSDHYAELGMDARDEIRRRAADARLIIDAATEFNVPVSMVASLASNVQPEAINAAAAGDTTAKADPGFTPFPSAGNP